MDFFFSVIGAPIALVFWLAKGRKTKLLDEILDQGLRNGSIVILIFAGIIIALSWN